jgi:glycine dehydrogenase subunit 2
MMEPTETESKETLDRFAEALIEIASQEATYLQHAPHTLPISRPDVVKADREPILRWTAKV